MDEKMLKIAGLQMLVTKDILQNEKRIIYGIDNAAKDRADLLLTPEGSLSGYGWGFNQDQLDAALGRVTEYARKKKVGLALGTCFRERKGAKSYCYNQVRLYDQNGEFIGAYTKYLRCIGEMRGFHPKNFQTFLWKGIKFGCLICNDLWATPGWTSIPNPYLSRRLKLMGAKFILHSIYSGLGDKLKREYHEVNVSYQAKAYQIPIVEVNAAPENNLPSSARCGLVNPDGTRKYDVKDRGEQYFTCMVPLQ